jgi:hypothetical protein
MVEKMKEIVINDTHGCFDLSYEAVMLYAELSGFKLYAYIHDNKDFHKVVPYEYNNIGFNYDPIYNKKLANEQNELGDYKYRFNISYIKRDDPILIQVVEKLGDKANTPYSKLKIVEIPDDVEWQIQSLDGNEWIAEKHRTWY